MATIKGSTIGGRLNRILYVAAVCFVICIATSLLCISMLSNTITGFVNDEYKIATNVSQVMRGNQGMGRYLCQMMLASNNKDLDIAEGYYNEGLEYRATMHEGLEGLKNLVDSDSVNYEDVDRANELSNKLPDIIERIHELSAAGKGDAAWGVYENEYAPNVTEIRDIITKVLDASNASAEAHIKEKDQLVLLAYVLTIAIGLIALITIYLLIKSNSRAITKPIKQLAVASDRICEGVLESNGITYDEDDELGRLCKNFNKSAETISKYVSEIARCADAINNGKLNYKSTVDFAGDFKPIGDSLEQLSISLSSNMAKIGASADQVYSGAEQMSSVGTQLSQSAVEQASSVQELVSTINTVSDHVSMNAATAIEVRESANALYDSMNRYSVLLREVNATVAETRNMTDEVRGIVRNLETISFQTNTLALNAAVEAARAGEAGRGFAVIADEIRELATEANRATANTSLLLNDMVTKISTAADQSQRAINSLEPLLAEGSTTAANVDKITNASNDQSSAIEQVRQSIRELSQSIQGITSTAEESAASAEELQGQMKLLNQMVDSFEIRKDI